ncbi:MAG: hypothetical protein AAGK22_23750 [Acidobacteriota bacterium]
MEMSPDYAETTARALARSGYSLHKTRSTVSGNRATYGSTRYELRAPNRRFVLEVVDQEGEPSRYFLEIGEHHGLRTVSLELDSWKFGDRCIEFRYVTDPRTGGAVTFILDHPEA